MAVDARIQECGILECNTPKRQVFDRPVLFSPQDHQLFGYRKFYYPFVYGDAVLLRHIENVLLPVQIPIAACTYQFV